MNEAKQLQRDLMNARLPILPRTISHAIRRVGTLAWAITGLGRTGTVRLSAWAEEVTSAAQYAASKVRRFARWRHNPAIHPAVWYPPLLPAALLDWTAGTRASVALDTTVLAPFVLIRAALISRGRAIPLAWRAVRRTSALVRFAADRPVLDQVRAIVPRGVIMTVLADRGFLHAQRIDDTRQQHWHSRLPMTSATLVPRAGPATKAVEQLRPPLGHAHVYQHVAIFGTAIGPVHRALASPADQPTDPWYSVSDEPTDRQSLDAFALRFDIEAHCLDDTSGGFHVPPNELPTPEALERVLLMLAIATLHCTSSGVGVVRAHGRRWVATHWDRGRS